jgi:hypothetical protein
MEELAQIDPAIASPNRVWLGSGLDLSQRRVTRALDKVTGLCGNAQAIRCENWPERASRHSLA